jgi:hypothetical protein
MSEERNNRNPLREYFHEAVHDSMSRRLGLAETEDLELYMADLLARFIHEEKIFALRDGHGRRVKSLPDMLAEGDIRLNADSFEREREVHRHVGDFLLFWSGLFPEFLESVGASAGDGLIDAVRQGSESYFIVSSFDYAPFDGEAPMFRKLSREFEACRTGLNLIRSSFEGFRRGRFDA